ncbi:hypothetical protein BVH03_17875 [Pseudomonas sp. PA15(2017)]|uniref:hypothetical protein n=1 Tax=Pseudomonas sp. PA15(2017) TaxID=1932111 RepID=UPI000958E67D|nr:hypothetical protein [Pseudomonas sp. PA15(2017)]OLU25518.1 hypothetical protein BVH03_17875 [Pseudomonas sp. PA15(2017)]
MYARNVDPFAFVVAIALGIFALIAFKIAQLLGSDYILTLEACALTILALAGAAFMPFVFGVLRRRYTVGFAVWWSYTCWFDVIRNIGEKYAEASAEYSFGGAELPFWATDSFLYGSAAVLAVVIIVALNKSSRY